ncbi:MAG TPA: FMN-binding protein, partial [Clostridia bacterium]|nr:FMN-binding protein [Clostridia bacterium]
SDPLEVVFEGQTYIYYQGFEKDGRTLTGYIFTTVTKGYGGDVKLMSGISNDGKVSGIEVLELSETPGLGMKAYDDFFLKQFLGKGTCISVVQKDADDNSVCAITGATITTQAVAGAVNIALELFDLVTQKIDPADPSAADADEKARKLILPTADSFEGPAKAYRSGEGYDYYTGKDAAGQAAGYIFETRANGYDGIVLVHTAVDNKGLITGVKVVATNDTPELGTKVKDADFVNQFIGKSGKVNLTTATHADSVQTITGATISSSAVVNAVNTALELDKSLAGGTLDG